MLGGFTANLTTLRLAVALAALFLGPGAVAQNDPGATAPDFQRGGATAWVALLNDLGAPPSGPGPVSFDKAHPYVANNLRQQQPTYRIADVTSPILKPWAAEQMRKENEAILNGKIAFTARSFCAPAGVPGFASYIVEPIYFIQTPKLVLIVFQGNAEVRRVYMNVPHSKQPKPSWYGESVGHYEGDTLVVDTIGFNTKTYVDNYRTPHTEKLHVVERYRLVDGGRILQNDIRVEDPDAFTAPWGAVQRYRRVEEGPFIEVICAENNLAEYHVPESRKPDF